MLYDTFAPRFLHDTVVIGFLPINDFTDNDPEYELWNHYEHFRYRPYYKKTASGYEVFHKGTFESGRTLHNYYYRGTSKSRTSGSDLRGLIRTIFRYTWTGGFYYAMRGALPARSIDIDIDVSNR